ncbi:MAG: peptidoglycan DD-metalloendopeptidase family protein [Anaerolineaceae bacterium]
MNKRIITSLIMVCLIFIPLNSVYAQDSKENPVYIIQSGDTLNIIAQRFGISVDELIAVNQLENPNYLTAGTELIIPGLEGVSGVLTTESIPFGINLKSISSQNQVPLPIIIKLNHLTSPQEVYAGSNLIFPQNEQNRLSGSNSLSSGQSMFEAAILHNENPWVLQSQNQVSASWDSNPGEPVYYLQLDPNVQENPGNLFSNALISPLPMVQGSTITITIPSSESLEINGSLSGHTLSFFKSSDHTYSAMQGIHALAEPGLTTIDLLVKKANGEVLAFEQMLPIIAGGYGQESLVVDSVTIDPAVTKPEDDQVKALVTPVTPEKYWTGGFIPPVDQLSVEDTCIKSWFGTRRSYNGSPYNAFHTGLDYGICVPNFNVYAPAAGKVVFAGPLTVRGNATYIDHGQGIYSGFFHQESIQVSVGDMVQPGQLIGQIGATGRVTGPHLHWEVWVNGVQVDPIDWLNNIYPLFLSN